MAYIRGIFYSLPLQLVFLHFRKYQVLLLFWFILFSIVSGSLMKTFGADALFLAPEYLGNVNAMSAAIMGMSIGVFIMCWNITTFILFSRHFKFLAATQYPFLKYCINNSVLPLTFLIYYLVRAYRFSHYKELISNIEIFFLSLGFLGGLILILAISFFYFFRADKTILRKLQPLFKNAKNYIAQLQPGKPSNGYSLIHSEYFLDSFTSFRRCRDVSHYSEEIMDKIFKRHHFTAVISVVIAVAFLMITGFFLENRFLQIPAAASITLFFGILIGVSGALTYYLQSWSVPFLVVFLLFLNFLYRNDWIDPRNKAYGLNYNEKQAWPFYDETHIAALNSRINIENDKQNMVTVLNKWKSKQGEPKPLMVIMTTSGGGNRSAAFTMNVLQQLDSVTNGLILKKTFLITGASGGMIGATYFRELYRKKIHGEDVNLQEDKYVDNIAEDLLNPTVSSFVARDLLAPAQHFYVSPYRYIKDRAYAFETKLNDNTNTILNGRIKDYVEDESNAAIPLIIYHSVINRDAKKFLISTQPIRFMMSSGYDTTGVQPEADAIDFMSFFKEQNPYNLRLLTALRMSATFPIILPSVWLPSKPVVDVMDGGLRDNFGMENALRFLNAMNAWIKENTRGVLIVQIRDRPTGGWDNPYELEGFQDHTIKPILLLQHNWHKMMEYFQNDMYSYYASSSGYPIHKISFQYTSGNAENKAALNFHLTKTEKKNIALSLQAPINIIAQKKVDSLLNQNVSAEK